MGEVKCVIENNIAILSIDRPKALNALSRSIVDEIEKVVDEIADNKDVRVLIIHSDKNFAAGADIGGMVDCDCEGAKAFAFSSTFNKIENLKIPTIAAIEGYALGGGLELALTCDLRIASEDAKMGFPEINLGIFPGAGGTIRAPKLIGIAKAKELILMGGTIDANEAEKIGLVNKVAKSEEIMEVAMKWASKLSQKAQIALKLAKETINEGFKSQDIKAGIALEGENWATLFNTEDQKEGMKAFLEKRKPEYTGK